MDWYVLRPFSTEGPWCIRINLGNDEARAARGIDDIVVGEAGAEPAVGGFCKLHQDDIGLMTA